VRDDDADAQEHWPDEDWAAISLRVPAAWRKIYFPVRDCLFVAVIGLCDQSTPRYHPARQRPDPLLPLQSRMTAHLDGSLNSLLPFLECYPFPAFILDNRIKPGQFGISLNPIATNRPFKLFLTGHEHSSSNSIGDTWLEAFSSLDHVKAYTAWLIGRADVAFTTTLSPSWIVQVDSAPYPVALVKTLVGEHLIITTSLQSPLPNPLTPPKARSTKRSSGHEPGLRLDIPNLPGYPLQVPTSNPFLPAASGDVKHLIAATDWSKVGMPPVEQWPQSLQTALSYILASVYPMAIWWGEDHIMLYNDAYARVTGNKHPRSFGVSGRIGWGELWPIIAQLVDSVYAGDTVARIDELFFLDRLGENLLPEETYHSWSFIPLVVEGGGIGGFINQTFGESFSTLLIPLSSADSSPGRDVERGHRSSEDEASARYRRELPGSQE
jgi:hypothetical protein